MTKPTLTLKDVVLAGRKAYEEGRLSAQNSTPQCAYRDKSGNPCVVGAAMSDGLVNQLFESDEEMQFSQNSTVEQLERGGGIEVPPEDIKSMRYLQELHDNWAQSVVGSRSYGTPENCEAVFKDALYGYAV